MRGSMCVVPPHGPKGGKRSHLADASKTKNPRTAMKQNRKVGMNHRTKPSLGKLNVSGPTSKIL
ncbi:uncharacterized protein TrAtP1_000636 [Trichoderma atroviride]|uniref:uncharacterized protein n=1 Tax=Hypocrea atroviridis TaxID=63577 RepID=UPI0033237C62|nr:hypothetical protein TrAtP1_000636 [Trichoderma atroviride]